MDSVLLEDLVQGNTYFIDHFTGGFIPHRKFMAVYDYYDNNYYFNSIVCVGLPNEWIGYTALRYRIII
jgi:hypothetical protein